MGEFASLLSCLWAYSPTPLAMQLVHIYSYSPVENCGALPVILAWGPTMQFGRCWFALCVYYMQPIAVLLDDCGNGIICIPVFQYGHHNSKSNPNTATINPSNHHCKTTRTHITKYTTCYLRNLLLLCHQEGREVFWWVCLSVSVCLPSHMSWKPHNQTSDFLCMVTVAIARSSSYVMYFLIVAGVMFSHNGLYGALLARA